MRVCYCPINCLSESSLAHYSPCPLKLEDVKQASLSPSPVSVVLEEESSETEKAFDVEKSGLDEGRVVEVVLKSSLKKPAGCREDEVDKRGVKWMDLVGKELVEIREFEPLESREAEKGGNGNPTCTCVIL